MSTKIDGFMSLEIDGQVIATAKFSEYSSADGQGAWIVSTYPASPVHPEHLVVRHGDDVVQLVVCDLGEAGAVQTGPAHRAPVRPTDRSAVAQVDDCV